MRTRRRRQLRVRLRTMLYQRRFFDEEIFAHISVLRGEPAGP